MIMLNNDQGLVGFFLCVWTLNDHGVPEVIDNQFYPIDHVGSYILPHHWVRQGIWFNQMYMAIFDKTSILEKKTKRLLQLFVYNWNMRYMLSLLISF